MTIRELYEWAEKHNALDLNLMKNINLDFYDIHDVYLIDFGELNCDSNVILDYEISIFKKLRLWKERKYSDTGYLYVKYFNHPYINKKIIGADIKLTLWQRIQILFCGGISILMSGKDIGGTGDVNYER